MKKRLTKESAFNELQSMRNQLKDIIDKKYDGIAEQFCWDLNLNKATISNFLLGKKDFRISTLKKIAESLGKRLTISMESK